MDITGDSTGVGHEDSVHLSRIDDPCGREGTSQTLEEHSSRFAIIPEPEIMTTSSGMIVSDAIAAMPAIWLREIEPPPFPSSLSH